MLVHAARVLRLHRGATVEGAVEATVNIHSKTFINQLFGDVNIFSVVLSKNDNFNVILFLYF